MTNFDMIFIFCFITPIVTIGFLSQSKKIEDYKNFLIDKGLHDNVGLSRNNEGKLWAIFGHSV